MIFDKKAHIYENVFMVAMSKLVSRSIQQVNIEYRSFIGMGGN